MRGSLFDIVAAVADENVVEIPAAARARIPAARARIPAARAKAVEERRAGIGRAA